MGQVGVVYYLGKQAWPFGARTLKLDYRVSGKTRSLRDDRSIIVPLWEYGNDIT